VGLHGYAWKMCRNGRYSSINYWSALFASRPKDINLVDNQLVDNCVPFDGTKDAVPLRMQRVRKIREEEVNILFFLFVFLIFYFA
jgi:hypothetical protein